MGIISELSCKVAREISSYADAVDLSLKQSTFDVARFAGSGSPSMFAGGGSGGAQAQMYQEFKGWVYVAINAIARRAASQAVIAARKEMAEQIGKGKRLPSSKVPKSWREKANEGVAFEVLEGHKAVDVFDNPNPIQGRWEFTYTTVANMYISGEFYWVGGVVEGEDGDRLEVYSLPAHWIEDQHNGGLFTGYKLKLPGDYEGIPLEPEQVVRGYLPDPSNPLKGCISPLATQYPAVRTDAKIQKSQEVSYDNGIYPQMAITVGQTVDMDGKPTGQRPVLTGAQRRQIVAACRQLVGGVMNSNQPLVLDGLIEKVFPLTTAPREMDWLKSGDQVKTRIFQAFGLNPINVGEIAGSNRAQAAVADAHMCHDMLTECLTANGWVDACSITESTKIACYDQSRNRIVYRNPTGIHRFHYKGKMLRVSTQAIDMLVTLNHRCLVQSHEKPGARLRPWRFRTAEDIGSVTTPFRFKCAAPAACSEPAVPQQLYRRWDKSTRTIDPDDWAEFLGWYVSEGNCTRLRKTGYRVGLTQSESHNPQNCEIIRALCDRLPFKFRESRLSKQPDIIQWQTCDVGLGEWLHDNCGSSHDTKRVPRYVMEWPSETLEILLDAAIAGDGMQAGRYNRIYTTTSRQLADDIQELATKCGFRTYLRGVAGSRGRKDYWNVSINERDTATVRHINRTFEEYDDDVWCVTVDTGAFLVRRNGKVHVSGNCNHTINPVLDIMSNRATSWCQTLFDDPTLLVWWQPCRPNDEEQRLRENAEMRKHGDISRNEMRAEYGFSPLEEETGERKAILETVGGMQGAVGVLSSLARGEMTREQAIALLDTFFGEGVGLNIVGARPARPALPEPADDGTRAAYVHLLDMVSEGIAKQWSTNDRL